jgi:imidazolonepropionase
MERVDSLIIDANELLTLKGPSRARVGKEMGELGIIENGAVAIKNGRITGVGKTDEIKKKFKAEEVIDAKNKVVMPGFVDCHTHAVFAGSREDEFIMRLEGMSYMEILKRGGGILKTVRETRKASKKTLFELTKKRLDTMLKYGTTTVEIKSGYGLTTKDEIKLLEVINELDKKHPVDVVPTFMGAHAVPPEFKTDDYVDLIIEDMLISIAKRGLAEFCDVFCERGVFSVEQSRRILVEARKLGMKAKIHADEITRTGGAELAAEIKAVSAEHLLRSSKEGIRALAEANVIAVLLPATSFCLKTSYADARFMIKEKVPVALATDFNPGCMCETMQFALNLACVQMRMTPAEAIVASTINAAFAINKGKEVGSLEFGKKADILILDAPTHKSIPQYFGVSLVEKVIKNGKIIKI